MRHDYTSDFVRYLGTTTEMNNAFSGKVTFKNGDVFVNATDGNTYVYYNNSFHKMRSGASGEGGSVDMNDVEDAIDTHNLDTTSHADIRSVIPNAATSSNQLADKGFVNSSISTNTANFIGTFNSVSLLESYSGTVTNNDYAFVSTTDSAGNTLFDRYKYANNQWNYEYELNNSSFTSNQWNAINSGITSSLVNSISDKYEKPSSGIPASDLASSLQNDINNSVKFNISTSFNGNAISNTKYFLDEISTLDISLPVNPNVGDEIYFSFYNPELSATNISIDSDYSGIINNKASKHGELDLLYDGTIWNVIYIEYEFDGGETI